MASAVTVEKLRMAQKIEGKVLTGATSKTLAAGLDLQSFGGFLVQATVAALTGTGMTKLEIIASAAADMSSAVVVKDSGTIAADAVGDHYTVECLRSEVMQLATDEGAALRYVAPRVTLQNGADVVVASCIRFDPIAPESRRSGLTPASGIAS